jgi:hypothetical protein
MDAHAMSFVVDTAMAMAFACLGMLAGYVHLALVFRQVRALLSQAGGLPVLLALGRFPATLAAFAFAAQQGALPLAGALAGFLVVRAVLVRHPERLMS